MENKNYKLYEDGYILKENEYLLKIRNNYRGNVGFLTKLNQNKIVPINFSEWGVTYNYSSGKETITSNLPIYVVEEDFKSGWEISDFRIGKSQTWVKLIHPDKYAIEISLEKLINLIKTITIKNGKMIGEFKYDNKTLIKK